MPDMIPQFIFPLEVVKQKTKPYHDHWQLKLGDCCDKPFRIVDELA